MYVSGTGTLRNVQILSLAVLHSPNIKFCNTVPSIRLLKSKNDESPAVYVHKFTPKIVRNNFHLFVNKHVVCPTGCLSRDYFGGNNKLYRSKLLFFFFFTLDFYLSFFNIFFTHKNYK